MNKCEQLVFSAIPGVVSTPSRGADDANGVSEVKGGWNLPDEAWLPIVYWVFAGSCIGYSCNSFANTVLL